LIERIDPGWTALPAASLKVWIVVIVPTCLRDGVVAAVREAIKYIGEGGRMTTIGSGAAERFSFPGSGEYRATKAAVAGVTCYGLSFQAARVLFHSSLPIAIESVCFNMDCPLILFLRPDKSRINCTSAMENGVPSTRKMS